MNLIKKLSNTYGTMIATLNDEENEPDIEDVLDIIAQIPVQHFMNVLMEVVSCLPEDATFMDLIEGKYDDILDENIDPEKFIPEEMRAELEAIHGSEENEET